MISQDPNAPKVHTPIIEESDPELIKIYHDIKYVANGRSDQGHRPTMVGVVIIDEAVLAIAKMTPRKCVKHLDGPVLEAVGTSETEIERTVQDVGISRDVSLPDNTSDTDWTSGLNRDKLRRGFASLSTSTSTQQPTLNEKAKPEMANTQSKEAKKSPKDTRLVKNPSSSKSLQAQGRDPDKMLEKEKVMTILSLVRFS